MEISMDMADRADSLPRWDRARRVRLIVDHKRMRQVAADVTLRRTTSGSALEVRIYSDAGWTQDEARDILVAALRRGRGRWLKCPPGFLAAVSHELAEGAVVL